MSTTDLAKLTEEELAAISSRLLTGYCDSCGMRPSHDRTLPPEDRDCGACRWNRAHENGGHVR